MLQKLVFDVTNFKDINPEALGSLMMAETGDPRWTKIVPVPEHPFNKKHGFTSDVFLFNILEHEDGIYETAGFNFDHTIKNYTEFYSHRCEFGRHGDPIVIDYSKPVDIDYHYTEIIPEFGVADNIEQIKEHFRKAIIHPTNKIVISITEIRKDEQPSEGGWRWHKWGEYIGSKTPTREHIYDEPEIESVLCFHGYIVSSK